MTELNHPSGGAKQTLDDVLEKLLVTPEDMKEYL